MHHFPDKLKPPLKWLAWGAPFGAGFFCAFSAISFIALDREPMTSDELRRSTHAEQVAALKKAIAQRAEVPQIAQKVETKPLQQHLIAIREDLATVQFMLGLILALLGGGMASLLIAGLVTLIPVRPRRPTPSPSH